MRGRYLGLVFGGLVAVSNICYASIPRDINKDIDMARQKKTLDKKLEDKDNGLIREQAEAAAEYISGTKLYDAGTIYIPKRVHLDLNKILGGTVTSTDVFSARYKVIDGKIDVVTDEFYRSGEFPTRIHIDYILEDGKKGHLIIKVNVKEKPQN